MDRRRFLEGLAVTAAGVSHLQGVAQKADNGKSSAPLKGARGSAWRSVENINIEGHILVCEFNTDREKWKVYEDLRTREGAMTFLSSRGDGRVLTRSVEASFADMAAPYFGMSLAEVSTSGPDLLANHLLRKGDPDPEEVKSAVPPLVGCRVGDVSYERDIWNTFLGTKECLDTTPVYPAGNTRTYFPIQHFPSLDAEAAKRRYEGLLGGWLPAVRKLMPAGENAYYELLLFGDVTTKEQFIVQTWHRTTYVENGKAVNTFYGHSYPAFPPARLEPAAEAFYRGLLEFTLYWEKLLLDFPPTVLPQTSWVDMSIYSFAKELMVRPGGVYPKYGAIDEDYYTPACDGFQDTFTTALYANLEWGRFEMAGQILDNYYSDFVDERGMINMRGPETGQFGLTLSLIARFFNYTQDRTLLLKHQAKIEATAAVLIALHDESLRLPAEDPGYGLVHGWSESDSCLHPKPMTWWQPYFSNSALAARGLRDIARVWRQIDRRESGTENAGEWLRRSELLASATQASMLKNVRREMNPPYIGPLPGATLTFRQAMETEGPNPQQWPHRVYSELLQADILPPEMATLVIDCMRANGATTLGVVADIWPVSAEGRIILGFISYGYAQMLLRLDRVEEYLLFLYSHRFHDHTRGSWTAAETRHIGSNTFLFCIPAQQTIPLLVRWMLVLEDSDQDRLYFAKGLPRDWLLSGKPVGIEQAPTRWGRVNFKMEARGNSSVAASIGLDRGTAPKELHVKFRLPSIRSVRTITVNGQPATVGGIQKDTAIFPTHNQKHFEVVAHFN